MCVVHVLYGQIYMLLVECYRAVHGFFIPLSTFMNKILQFMVCFDMKTRSSEYYPTHFFISDFLKFLFCFNLIYMLTIDIELIFTLIFYVIQFCHT